MTFVSYAQNFEDVRLWRAFSDIGGGRYLDIGAQDPVLDSVSYAFYQRGWRGVHVEPTPAYAAALREARPDEKVIEAAVSCAAGPIRFFEIAETGLSTGITEIADRHAQSGWSERTIAVPTVTLAGLFDLMGDGPIHWLKIDVEGMEADVLESWGDHTARPAALVIEATAPNTQVQTHDAWYDLVIGRGYEEVLFDGLSRYFIHQSQSQRGEALALSPNVFDGFRVPEPHFTAGLIVAERDARLASERAGAAAERQALADAAAQELAATRAEAAAAVTTALDAAEAEVALVRAEASSTIEAQAQRMQIRFDDQAAAHGALLVEVRTALEARIAATELALADTQAALDAQRLLCAKLEREAGQFQGQLAAQALAHDARMGDAEDRRRELAERLASSEAALASAYQSAADLRGELSSLALGHAQAIASADAAMAALEAKIAQLSAEIAALTQQLSESEAGRELLGREAGRLEGQLAAQAAAHEIRMGEAEDRRRELAERLASSEAALASAYQSAADLRDELSSLALGRAQAIASANAAMAALEAKTAQLSADIAALTLQLSESEAGRELLGRETGQLSADIAALNQQLDEAHRQGEAQVAAHTGEAERLRAHIAWREGQLAHAAGLLAASPDPLAGWPRRFARLLARAVGRRPAIDAAAEHAATVTSWLATVALSDPNVAQAEQPSFAGNEAEADLADIFKGLDMLEEEGPITSVPRLLAPHDTAFISAAYQAVLGRAPDPEGAAYYLGRLRAGTHKLEILTQLRRSPEGRAFIPGVAGLDRAIRRHRRANLPLICPIIRLLTGAEGNSATQRQLRVIQNEIGRLRFEQNAMLSVIIKMGKNISPVAAPEPGQASQTEQNDDINFPELNSDNISKYEINNLSNFTPHQSSIIRRMVFANKGK